MLIINTTTRKPCKLCAGYGVFDRTDNETKLVPCPKCSSVHPEQYGLKIWKEGYGNYFYLVKSKIANFLADIELTLKK